MNNKREIPKVATPGDDGSRRAFDGAVKEDLEIIMGRRGDPIKLLNTAGLTGTNLTFAQKINEIINRLQ